MNQNLKNRIVLTIGIFLLSGCAGYDRVLFVTKTNVGLDIDDTPPTAEITVARRELAIAPTYQDTKGQEKTLPLLGSFGLTGGAFNPGISSVFAGGDAAVILVTEKGKEEDWDSSICLSKKPDARGPFKRFWHWITFTDYEKIEARAQTRTFYFATDTSFGVKVGWKGTGGPYPTSLKLGYNRMELASPPIFIKKGCEDGRKGTSGDWEVKVPSFFASLDNKSNFLPEPAASETGVPGTAVTGGVTHVQFFATGAVAKAWAGRSSVKKATFKRMAPEAAKIENKE
ncbi:MAG: hypothetical protein OEY91_00655 [Nitrospirota bacterium]|nr:hypothetical protein [Nitrospirota bacterium]